MQNDNGRLDALSPSVEPVPVSPLRASITDADMLQLRQYRIQEMKSLMSDISEDLWCAGWMSGNESALYGMAYLDASRRYGLGEVRQKDLIRLKELAELTGLWIEWDDVKGAVAVPLTQFAQAIEARRAETGTGSVHESAVACDAPDEEQ